MALTQLANLGEFLGGVAVLVTLVYLAFQMRQNTTALRQQSAHDSTFALQRVSLEMMNPAVADSVSRAYAETNPHFSAAESAAVENWMLSMLVVFQQDFLDNQLGLHRAELWEARKPMLRGVFASHWARAWWKTIGRAYYAAPFQGYVDALLAEGHEGRGAYWAPLQEVLGHEVATRN